MIRRALHAELAYHVLAHLPLSGDAASLYDPARPARPWVRPLHRAYTAADARLTLHALPLVVSDIEGLYGALAPGALAALDGATGCRLAECFAAALRAEHQATAARYRPAQRAADLQEVDRWLGDQLRPLRRVLYAPRTPPGLEILDSPALASGGWTHGRATQRGPQRVVAVALHVAPAHALCQILHEESHAVSDPPLRERWRGAPQDTRAGAAGHGLHAALEEAAVERGQAVLEAAGGDLLPTYARWRARYGI